MRYYSGIALRRTTNNLSQDSRSLSRQVKLWPPKYKAGMLPTRPRLSSYYYRRRTVFSEEFTDSLLLKYFLENLTMVQSWQCRDWRFCQVHKLISRICIIKHKMFLILWDIAWKDVLYTLMSKRNSKHLFNCLSVLTGLIGCNKMSASSACSFGGGGGYDSLRNCTI
jgi:hypothetical protein